VQANQPSPIRRGIRNASLILVFSLLGYAAGAAVVTWEYMQPPYERGTEEYTEVQEGIDEILEAAPICEQLRRDKWFEEPVTRASAPGNGVPRGDQHLINDTLSGVHGFTTKLFRHPEAEISMLVFVTGFGIDGWPDTVHGGAISSIIMEAHNKHLEPVMKQNQLEILPYSESQIGFLQMVKPGSVYAVLVVTHAWATGHLEGEGNHFIVNNADAFLYDLDEVTFGRQVAQNMQGAPQEVMAIDMKGEQHAFAKLTMCMRSNKVTINDGESQEDYLQRLDKEVGRIVETNSVAGKPS